MNFERHDGVCSAPFLQSYAMKSNGSLMFGHRLRRWPNIKPALDERLVFVSSTVHPTDGVRGY